MKIAGLQKFTLLDYPNKTACIIFTQGCNLKCPFCHNSTLIGADVQSEISEEYVFDFLKSRVGKLDGVVITGGEPLLQPDLIQFILKIKELGFLVKLDTNGFLADKLQEVCKYAKPDYVAMDVKNSLDKYQITCDCPNLNTFNIIKSIQYLINYSYVDYEFRTTVVKNFHTENDMIRIAKMIRECKRYYLQQFVKSENVLDDRCEALSDEDMKRYLTIVRNYIPNAELRGVNIDGT